MKKRLRFWALLLILSLAGTGCGDGRQTEKPAHNRTQSEAVSKTGALSYGYFYGEDGISLSTRERFLYSEWEPVEFDYICMDPMCSHLNESCSARTVQDEAGESKDFSVLYQGRLIILHAYSRFEINQLSETVQEWIQVYQTDVYEADPDGSNRRKVATFSGSIDSPTITHAAVLADGRLYFGGTTETRQRIESDISGRGTAVKTWVSAAVYSLDLNDYTIETFTVMEGKEGELSYLYQIYEYEGMIYWSINFRQDDSAVLYRFDPEAGACEEILHFDSSDTVVFGGVIGNTVYYWYEESRNTLYARNISAGAKERKIMTIPGEDIFASPFIVDGQLWITTDRRMEGEERKTEYAVLDPEGNVIDMIRYDSYIDFLDVVGDKIIYFRLDSDWKVWWADKEDLVDLTEKGVPIGPFYGQMLDTLAD